MKRYDELILNELMDKYEGSLLYTGRNQRKQTIRFAVTPKAFPEYFDETLRSYDDLHEQMKELEQKGFVKLLWREGKADHILEKVELRPEKADEIYEWLRRRPKSDKEAELLSICEEESGFHPLIDAYLSWIRERLEAGESIRAYANPDEPSLLKKRCRILREILGNTEDTFLREFSVRFWKDSKAAEKELGGAVSVIIHFSENDVYEGLDTWQVLEEFGIFRNPSWVILKGAGAFRMLQSQGSGQDQEEKLSDLVRIEEFPGGLGLSSADILNVVWEKDIPPAGVLTIENLTSFHRFHEEGTLCVYLGGYHNHGKRLFLQGLYEAFREKDVPFAHFGDIDCGGFRIWRDLREKTQIPFAVRFMDIPTYVSHLDHAKALSVRDRKDLAQMVQDPYYADQKELFERMLKEGKKIEQESVRLL